MKILAPLSLAALAASLIALTPAHARDFQVFKSLLDQVRSAQSSGSPGPSGSDRGIKADIKPEELYSPAQQKLSFDACLDQFPARKALSSSVVPYKMKPLALCSDTFAVLYSPVSKTPLVTVERLDRARMADAKGEKRTDFFFEDPRIPKSGRASLADYRKQEPAVDRGHMAPAANSPTPNAMAQTFALTNMVPQDPVNNQKIWSKLEADVRKYASRASGGVFVYTGPLFDPGHSTVGFGKVWKPTRLFKLVYDEPSGRAWAYVMPNAEAPLSRPVDYATFVKLTGLTLLDGLPVTGSLS